MGCMCLTQLPGSPTRQILGAAHCDGECLVSFLLYGGPYGVARRCLSWLRPLVPTKLPCIHDPMCVSFFFFQPSNHPEGNKVWFCGCKSDAVFTGNKYGLLCAYDGARYTMWVLKYFVCVTSEVKCVGQVALVERCSHALSFVVGSKSFEDKWSTLALICE